MAFIETVVAAGKSTQKWHAFPDVTDDGLDRTA
jgi:hypothetical protein